MFDLVVLVTCQLTGVRPGSPCDLSLTGVRPGSPCDLSLTGVRPGSPCDLSTYWCSTW